jgi:PAS domain S-box-containing protein
VGTDAHFRVTQWSLGAERLYRYTAAQVLGLPADEVATFAGDDLLERDLLERGRPRLEMTAVRHDGTPVEVEVVATTMRDDAGRVRGWRDPGGLPSTRCGAGSSGCGVRS